MDKKDMKKNNKHLEEIKQLNARIDLVEDEKLLVENQLKKALADYANLERDLDKRIGLRMVQMKLEVARSLLNVLDDISLALDASNKLEMNDETKAWAEGIKATLSDVNKALSELGIVSMEVKVGDLFDSAIHEALTVSQEGEDGKIFQVIQPGFMLGEIVIRPARVIVGKKK